MIFSDYDSTGLGDAAVTLQRAWNRDPQSLPFAPYIKTHALVSLVQKGLQYYELEHSLDKDGNPIPISPSSYFFGPEPLDAEALKSQGGGPVHEAGDHGTDQPTSKIAETNGHLTTTAVTHPSRPKKSRKGEVDGDGDAMEIDATNGIVHEPPFPANVVDGDGDVSMAQDQEPVAAPPIFTLTNGHSVGVQITPAKAADLSPNTTILDVAVSGHVTNTLWRPRDPTVVAAAGDTFCSLWKLPSSSSMPVEEKLIENNGDNTCVSAIAWDSTGQKLAVATYSDMRGSITMYDVHGNAVDLLPEVPRMITGLHWAEQSSHLVVVASDSKISELALWDDSVRPDEFPSPQVVDNSIYDFIWLNDRQAYACGDGAVYQCDVDSRINISQTFSSGGTNAAWTYVRCADREGSPVVVTASTEDARIWVPTHDMVLDNAHQSEITAIELRSQSPRSDSERQSPHLVLASSSTDDTVKVWNIDLDLKCFNCVHRLFLGPSTPALTSSISPDWYALAAASKDKLYIWNIERGGVPMASWTVPDHEEKKKEDGPNGSLNAHSVSEELLPVRSLSWDADGKRLAFGFGKQVAIVNMQR